MKTLLITYIIVINLIGFFLMGIDKFRARRQKWRIRERTLFLVALFFGSIGVLVDMYVFRHKTRHLSFSLGIPAILFAQLLAVGLLFSWHQKRLGSPSQAVENELALIQQLDSGTIHSYVSYENLMNSHLASGAIDETASEAVALFFQNFKYSILNEQTDGDEAVVHVNITNIDTRALAQDLCREILRQSVAIYPVSRASTTSDYYRMLRDALAANSYETTVTPATFRLSRQDKNWVILTDRTLEDELVSGFITNMNDPYILPASEVLAIHLDALAALTADQWADYLSINDVFATYNTDYYQAIDREYIEQLAAAFRYKIIRCDENGDTANAVVRITSIDMKNVLTDYRRRLLRYAATTQSLRDDSVTFSNETSRLLLESLQENDSVTSTDVDMPFHNNGAAWEIYFGSDFTDALMGDMSGALEAFNASAQSQSDEIHLKLG